MRRAFELFVRKIRTSVTNPLGRPKAPKTLIETRGMLTTLPITNHFSVILYHLDRATIHCTTGPARWPRCAIGRVSASRLPRASRPPRGPFRRTGHARYGRTTAPNAAALQHPHTRTPLSLNPAVVGAWCLRTPRSLSPYQRRFLPMTSSEKRVHRSTSRAGVEKTRTMYQK